MDREILWYQETAEKALKALGSAEGGLSAEEARSRLDGHGYNEIKSKKRGPFRRFVMQFHNPLLYVLMVAAVGCVILDRFADADTMMDMWVILGVILGTALIGFIQEGKAEASLEALKKMIVPQCSVRRDGATLTVPTRELVPGDIVLLEEGDRVPADLRLISAKDLSADEAALTGESNPVGKNPKELSESNLGPADQSNMCFSGTFVNRGRGEGVVVATGLRTELGKIADLMQETKKISPPIIRKITEFTRFIIISILAFAAVVFTLGMFLGYDFAYMFLATVGMTVALIPEGLPGAVIAAFAMGAIVISRRHALIRRLPATETLGCTTVICSDKTGTLTRNEMTVTWVHAEGKDYKITGVGYGPDGKFYLDDAEIIPSDGNHAPLIDTLRAGLHCNNASMTLQDGVSGIKGDPTEGALAVSAAKASIEGALKRIDEIPFNPDHRYMATLNQDSETRVIFVKGSPERILEMCGGVDSEKILKKASEMAGSALRVIGIAHKRVDSNKGEISEGDLEGMTFLGLQGMMDPPREEAVESIRKCKSAGIRVIMITGDHVETARAIAAELGIGDSEEKAVSGAELEGMSAEELAAAVKDVSVYARAAPEHKYRIVDMLQKQGHVVAVTGDGVNDAPALKRADIGVAMGINGTEVSKEAADMVLTDDNFASIVAAVEEGRHVFTNIWKVILFIMPTNGGQGMAMAGAVLLSPFVPLFALRLPIEPVQILWVNLIMAIFCAIPLIWEPKEKGILDRPPRHPDEKLFNSFFIQRVGLVSLVEVIAIFAMYLAFYRAMGSSEEYLAQAQTIAFTTIVLIEATYLFTARSVRNSAFTFSPFSNPLLVLGWSAVIGFQLLLIYMKPLFGISPFRTEPFPAVWWIPLILVAPAGFFAVEIEKLIRKRLARTSPHYPTRI